jgi:hypothetical protein
MRLSNQEVQYYFGRLNLITWVTKEKKKEYILGSLKSNATIFERGFHWGFFDVESISLGDDVYIYGLLVKYTPQSIEEVVDEINKCLKTTDIYDKMISKNEFFLHLNSGILAYHTDYKCNSNLFKRQFAKIIEEANNNIFVNAEIISIDDETKIFDAIMNFDKVQRISLELHPSNPSNRELWKKTDDKIRNLNAQKYYEYYVGEDLHIADNHEVYGNVVMACDGYGKATVIGIKSNKKLKVSTDKMPISQYAGRTIRVENKSEILSQLTSTFKKVLERFKHKNE